VNESPGKEGTVNASLRISEAAYKVLQKDAKKRNTSVNTLANQILVAYAEYESRLGGLGLLRVTRPTFLQILNAGSDEAMAEAGTIVGEEVTTGVILSSAGEITALLILDWLKRIATYSNLVEYTEISHGGKTSVTLEHSLGPKWSVFLSSYVESLFRSVNKQVKCVRLSNSVTFEVEV